MSQKRPESDEYKINQHLVAMAGLFLFGLAYDKFVGWLERNGYERGVTAWIVVLGTAVTIIPILFIWGIKAFFRTFSLFVASGSPMIIGATWRYMQERDEERAANCKAAELL